MRPLALCPLTVWSMLWGAPAVAVAAPAPEDPYLAGYAGAVLEREFKVTRRAVTVDNGVLTLDGAQLAGADRAARRDDALEPAGRGPRRGARGRRAARPAVVPDVAPAAVSALPTGLLPAGHLFQPLLADPRWPHFSAAYRYYLNNRDLRARGRGELRRDHPALPGQRLRGQPVGGGHPGRRVRALPDGRAVEGPAQRRLLRLAVRHLAPRPVLRARARSSTRARTWATSCCSARASSASTSPTRAWI